MRYVAIITFMLIGLGSFAQSKKEIKEADKLFKKEMYEEAMPMYQKFINIDPTNSDYAYKYGSCAVMLNKNNEKALEYLLIARKGGKSDAEVGYFIGRAYENKEDYDNAILYYEKFMDAADKEQVKSLKVKKRVKACKKANKAK
jgi:tetratricopeptide (TPR) repeat protein